MMKPAQIGHRVSSVGLRLRRGLLSSFPMIGATVSASHVWDVQQRILIAHAGTLESTTCGSAVSLDGATNGWEVPVLGDPFDVRETMTLFMLVRFDSSTADSGLWGGGVNQIWRDNFGSNDRLGVFGGSSTYSGNGTLEGDGFRSIAVTQHGDDYGSVDRVAYIDGVRVLESFRSLRGQLSSFYVGSTVPSGKRLNGAIAACYVWRRALHDADITALSRDPWAMYRPRRLSVAGNSGPDAPWFFRNHILRRRAS